MDSILTSIKKLLGLESDYTHFDTDIIIFINSVLLSLNQFGVGPEDGFLVTGSNETWTDFIGDRKDIEAIKTLIFLKVKLVFDPPTSSFVIEAMERQIKELEWRLNIQVDKPVIPTVPVEGGI